MAALIDSSYLIAVVNRDDVNHKRAKELAQELKSGKYGSLIVLESVFNEFVTFIRKRARNPEHAVNEGSALLNDRRFSVAGAGKSIFEEGWNVFVKNKELSFTDAVIVSYMKNTGIKLLFSFDRDFDAFSFIKRVF